MNNADFPASTEVRVRGTACTYSMNNADFPADVKLRPRNSELVSIFIPVDTLEMLHRVASTRDMDAEALVKFYIGQGLRQDAARLFSDRILETTA